MGGTALEYWAGGELMKSLPVAGELSQAMGGWLNRTVGPLLPGGASPAGEAMFTRLSADTMLDLGLDTMPHFLEDLKNGLPVGEAGARALWSILGNTAGNTGSELSGQYLDRLLSPRTDLPAPKELLPDGADGVRISEVTTPSAAREVTEGLAQGAGKEYPKDGFLIPESELPLFRDVDMYEETMVVNGHVIDALAEVHVVKDGKRLFLDSVTIYARDGDIPNEVGASAFMRWLKKIRGKAKKEGFQELEFRAERALHSTSANPGRKIDRAYDLITGRVIRENENSF